MNISTLMDLARQHAKIRSDRHLAMRMEMSTSGLSGWRRGISTPSPDDVIFLCELADIPPEVGLAWRNVWHAEDRGKSICIRIAEDVTKNAGVSLPSEAA